MFVLAPVTECDFTGERFESPVQGIHCFSRGATGRVCCVMYGGPEQLARWGGPEKAATLEEVQAWAESEPGGYLDY